MPATPLPTTKQGVNHAQTTAAMKKSMSLEQFEKLAKKAFVTFPARASISIETSFCDESGDTVSVNLSHNRGEYTVDGNHVSHVSRVPDSKGNSFPVFSSPTWQDVCKAVFRALGRKSAVAAALFCDDQDEAFLRSTGQISR